MHVRAFQGPPEGPLRLGRHRAEGSLPELTLEEARQAEVSIRHAALEDYRREPLLAALHLKFPDLLADQDADRRRSLRACRLRLQRSARQAA